MFEGAYSESEFQAIAFAHSSSDSLRFFGVRSLRGVWGRPSWPPGSRLGRQMPGLKVSDLNGGEYLEIEMWQT
jgi:hypothetical protein